MSEVNIFEDVVVVSLDKSVHTPTRATPESAGLDIYCPEDFIIGKGKTIKINTKMRIKVPNGHVGRVLGRSSLESPPNCLHVLAGTIDADYTGELGIVFKNLGLIDVEIKKNQRFAQLVVFPVVYPEVKEVEEMPDTQRGSGGFGSTGK